jgi:hypothetical protein
MSRRFTLGYLTSVCWLSAAAFACDEGSRVPRPHDDGAAALAELPSGAPDADVVTGSDATPSNAGASNAGASNAGASNAGASNAGASNAETMSPAPAEKIEPEWSDDLRVCPPSEGYPVLGYALTRQNHIDEFEGCERIDAALTIYPFEGVDLRPLRSLREVRGKLVIGDPYGSYPHAFTSLEGLEGLRRVRGLRLSGIQAHDLEVLRDLERVDDPERPPFFDGSSLEIIQAENLVDLHGLEKARGIYSLRVEESPALRSLQGVHITRHPNLWANGVSITGSPVEDFADIGAQTQLGLLGLAETPLASLQPFAALRSVGALRITQNPDLVDVGALAQLESLQALEVTANPLLVAIPELPLVTTLTALRLVSNPLLAAGPRFPQVAALSELFVTNNPSLERLDGFPALQRLVDGTISDNDHLLGVDLGSLLEVTGTLRVRDNPELDSSPLAAVPGRIKRSGNRDPAPTMLSPCPWPDDDECDESSDLCAPGTDPICAEEDY